MQQDDLQHLMKSHDIGLTGKELIQVAKGKNRQLHNEDENKNH